MRTKVIAGFPGIGKTECKKLLGERAIDADSSMYSWIQDNHGKMRNPDFPKNYIDHLKGKIGKREYVFVSTHKEVRDALLDNCIFFYLVYPYPHFLEEYIGRYRARGSDENFIALVTAKWGEWLAELADVGPGCQKCPMGQLYLADELEVLFGGVQKTPTALPYILATDAEVNSLEGTIEDEPRRS